GGIGRALCDRGRRHIGSLREGSVLVDLVLPGGRVDALRLDHDLETDLDLWGHACFAKEAETGRRVGVIEPESRGGVDPIIPVLDALVNLTGDGQGHLAVSLARRGGLQLRYPLLQVCAAVPA